MISREKDLDYSSEEYCDLLLDDIVLSDFDEQFQHLLNIDCALALSVCKSRNFPSCVFVLSLLYMKRLRSLDLNLSLTKMNNLTTKELYLITTLLANKYLIDEGEDEQLFNSELAELTGLTNERINYLEKQILIAFNWNLFVSNDEFQRFFTLFKSHMTKKLTKPNENISLDDSIQFYNLCCKYLPQIFEYIAFTSIVLLGSTLSILTAVHLSTVTHSTLMKTFNPIENTCQPTMNCSLTGINRLFHPNEQSISDEFSVYSNETNEIFFPTKTSSCSIDILQPYALYRPMVQTIG